MPIGEKFSLYNAGMKKGIRETKRKSEREKRKKIGREKEEQNKKEIIFNKILEMQEFRFKERLC